MVSCPVCGEDFGKENYQGMAKHFRKFVDRGEPTHHDWLRAYVPLANYNDSEFDRKLQSFYDLSSLSAKEDWFTDLLVHRFFGEKPHEFIDLMQRPRKATFMGFVMESYGIVKQRIRSLAAIVAKSEEEHVHSYVGSLLVNELVYDGSTKSSTYLLLRMAEAVGITRDTMQTSMPLPPTLHSIKFWNGVSESSGWLEILSATNVLDLVYDHSLKDHGAKMAFFGSGVLDNEWIPDQVKEYLIFTRDVIGKKSRDGLKIIVKHASESDKMEDAQSSFLRSIDALDRHYQAIVTRIRQFENR